MRGELSPFTARTPAPVILAGGPHINAPLFHPNTPGDPLPAPIGGTVNLWVSAGTAMRVDPSPFPPGTPVSVPLAGAPPISALLTTPKPPVEPWLHVEAVANTEAVRDAAIEALVRA